MRACPSCGAEVVPGTQWCGVCRMNMVDPRLGHLASPGRRLGAYVLDMLIPLFGLIAVAGLTAGSDSSEAAALLVVVFFRGYLGWALYLFAQGATPGKRIVGLRVVTSSGRYAGFVVMLIREWIGKMISGFVFTLGYLWILIDRDHQGSHDKLVSTYVAADGLSEPARARAGRSYDAARV